jgi:APA family basic amino acid/polyamine antiporter
MNFPVGGKVLGPWVGLIAAFILLICANAGLIGCSRLTFSMGEYYQVPNSLFKLHSRFRTPYVALAVFSILAIVVILASRNKMLFLVDLYNFGAQIAFFSAHLALIILRCKKPELPRPFRAPLNIPLGKGRSIPLTAVLGAFASFSVWLLVVVTKPEGRVMGLSWMAIGIAMYYYYRKRKKIAPTGQLKLETIKIPEYKPMRVKHVLVAARSTGGTEALQTAFQLARHYNAKATASMPIDAPMPDREKHAELALKRAEAVAHEFHLTIHLELVRSRSIQEALLQLIESGDYDLVIVGADRKEFHHSNFALQAEKLLRNAPCRVYFCRG